MVIAINPIKSRIGPFEFEFKRKIAASSGSTADKETMGARVGMQIRKQKELAGGSS